MTFIYVKDGFQRQGIGSTFIDFLEKWVRENMPEIRTISIPTATPKSSGEFYKKVGYSKVAEEPYTLGGLTFPVEHYEKVLK